MKKTIHISLLLTGIMFLACTSPSEKTGGNVCKNVIITVKDSAQISFITKADVEKILKQSGLNPKNRKNDSIFMDKIEQELKKHKAVKQVECYPTSSGSTVRIDLWQREPVFRVLGSGSDYYIDVDGILIPSVANYVAYVPVATGNISQEFARNELKDFISILQKDDFWSAQIVQIDVQPDGKQLILVPRLGKHVIEFGSIERTEQKLEKLKTFYLEVLEKTGWDKFQKISVKFKDQLVVS